MSHASIIPWDGCPPMTEESTSSAAWSSLYSTQASPPTLPPTSAPAHARGALYAPPHMIL